MFTIGVIEGSSELGLSQQEYEALSPAERDRARDRVEARFRAAGADAVVRTRGRAPAAAQAGALAQVAAPPSFQPIARSRMPTKSA